MSFARQTEDKLIIFKRWQGKNHQWIKWIRKVHCWLKSNYKETIVCLLEIYCESHCRLVTSFQRWLNNDCAALLAWLMQFTAVNLFATAIKMVFSKACVYYPSGCLWQLISNQGKLPCTCCEGHYRHWESDLDDQSLTIHQSAHEHCRPQPAQRFLHKRHVYW